MSDSASEVTQGTPVVPPVETPPQQEPVPVVENATPLPVEAPTEQPEEKQPLRPDQQAIVDRLKGITPDSADKMDREMTSFVLESVAGAHTLSFVERKIENLMYKVERGGAEGRQAREELAEWSALQEEVLKRSQNVDKQLAEMRKSADPQQKAVALDIMRAMNAYKIGEYNQELRQIVAAIREGHKNAKPEELDEIIQKNKRVQQTQQMIRMTNGERSALDAEWNQLPTDGSVKKNVVEGSAKMVYEIWKGGVLTDEDVLRVHENPIGAIEACVVELVGNKKDTAQFIAKLVEQGVIPKGERKALEQAFSGHEGVTLKMILFMIALITGLTGFSLVKSGLSEKR